MTAEIVAYDLLSFYGNQYLSKLKILFRVAVKPYGIIQNNFMPDIEIIKDISGIDRIIKVVKNDD